MKYYAESLFTITIRDEDGNWVDQEWFDYETEGWDWYFTRVDELNGGSDE
jgi:hypothetical protein